MRKWKTMTWAVGAVFAALPPVTGCDDDDDDFDDPAVAIVSPSAGTVQELELDDMKVGITIDPDDFELDDPDDCGADQMCGRAVLKIDGDACNAPGAPFNSVVADDGDFGTTTISADFSLCPADRRLGTHQVTVSLQRHDGSAVMRLDGTPAEASISFTTELDED